MPKKKLAPPPAPAPMLGEMGRLSLWALAANREKVAAALKVPLADVVAELDGQVRVKLHRALKPGEMERLAAKLEEHVPGIRVRIYADGEPANPAQLLPPIPLMLALPSCAR
jgi:hypothetical protein